MNWLDHIRMFLGTSDAEFLASAVLECQDPVIKSFLAAAIDAVERKVSRQDWPRLAHSILPSAVEPRSRENLEEVLLRLLYLTPFLIAGSTTNLELNVPIADECVELAKRFDLIEVTARTEASWAQIPHAIGNPLDALSHYERAVSLYKQLVTKAPVEWTPHLTEILTFIAYLCKDHGLLARAEEALREALVYDERIKKVQYHVVGPFVVKDEDFATPEKQWELERLGIPSAKSFYLFKPLELSQDEEWWRRFGVHQHNLGDILREREQFFVAKKHLSLALRARLRLTAISPRHRFSLARTLNNFGRCEREMAERGLGDGTQLRRAIHYLRRALKFLTSIAKLPRIPKGDIESLHHLRESLVSVEPEVVETLGLAMENLANSLGDAGNHFEAIELAWQAKEVFRQLALTTRDPAHRRRFVASCIDQIAALLEAKHNKEARSLLPELLREARQLASENPDLYSDLLAFGLSYAGMIFSFSGERYAMITSAEEAIRLCERQPANFRLRGQAAVAYILKASYYAGVGGSSGFGCLAALRDRKGVVKDSSQLDVNKSVSSLKSLEKIISRQVVVIVAEQVGSDSILGILSSSEGFAALEVSKNLARQAEKLLHAQYVVTVPMLTSRNLDLIEIATETFDLLPEMIKRVLTSHEYFVIISGNAFWNAFPWELLTPPGGKYLGLDHPFPRWGPIDHDSLLYLAPKVLPLQRESTVVACPLCSPSEQYLEDPLTESFLREYRSVLRILERHGVRFESRESILLGKNGDISLTLRRMMDGPTLFHFIGHGSSAYDGSLIVWDVGGDREPPRLINPSVLFESKAAVKIERCFKEGGIVFLNCCSAGYERHFGGRGQDLASKLLEEGADVVLASYLPIYDPIGRLMSTAFYQVLLGKGLNVGDALLGARRRLQSCFERTEDSIYLEWSFVRMNGNPFVTLGDATRHGEPFRPAANLLTKE